MSVSKTLLGGPGVFHFEKQGRILGHPATAAVEVRVRPDTAVAEALAANSAFPAGDIKLGAIGVGIDRPDSEIHFGAGRGQVRFGGSGGFRSGFGVYETAAVLREDLDPSGEYLRGVELPHRGVARFVALRWDYDIKAAAAGAVALGYGVGVQFGAEAAAGGFFAVIRAFAKQPKARDAFASTVADWKLPRQVRSPESLSPGTWLVAEVDGGFALRLGAQFGYDFNWIRKLGAGRLSGDVGLRVQAAVNATLGFEAAGKYLVVVARPSTNPAERTLRLQLYKVAKKGWDFALNARATATGDSGRFLPPQLDDFLASVLGVHGPQLVEDLKSFPNWTDPSAPLEKRFADFLSDYAASEFGDAASDLEKARSRVAGFLEQWDRLPHPLASFLWSEARRTKGRPTPLEKDLLTLANANSGAIRDYLEQAMTYTGFYESPLGRWLANAVTGSLLAAISDPARASGIREAARNSLALLTGKVLTELAAYAARKMGADQVKGIANLAQFQRLEPWLQERIKAFLGGTVTEKRISQLRETLHILEKQADKLYKRAIQALNSSYKTSVHYTYASSSTRTALMDIVFDFAKDPTLGPRLRRAIRGDWADLLLKPRPGISLRQATLTHGLRRQRHIEITLPFGKHRTLDKLNQSLARMDIVDEGGRLFVYDAGAKDTERAGKKWQSSLMVTGRVTAALGGSVRYYARGGDTDALSWDYSLRQAVEQMRSVQLEEQVRPLAAWYFPRAFGGAAAPEKASLTEWVSDLDRNSEAVLRNGTGNLGNTLLSLEVSLPGKTIAAWLKAPSKHATRREQQPYMEMSRAIQRAMRRLIPYCYFTDPALYTAARLPIAASVLVYRCLPVTTSIRLSRNRLRLNTDRGVYWDYLDPAERRAMIYCSETAGNLRAEMERVRRLLEDHAGLRKWAPAYDPEALEQVLGRAWTTAGRNFLANSLLRSEAILIRGARRAGYAMAEFREAAATNPEKALAALARFGQRITKTFNQELNQLFGGETSRALASLVFLEAARALDAELAGKRPSAILEITILKDTAPAGWKSDFIEGRPPAPEHVVLRQPVVSQGSPAAGAPAGRASH